MSVVMTETKEDDSSISFDSFGLDARLTRAISKLEWIKPTLIQAKAIPLALQGKDILARARTGSGKTAAYAIPVVQRILQKKGTGAELSRGSSGAADFASLSALGSEQQQSMRNGKQKKDPTTTLNRLIDGSLSSSPAAAKGVYALILVPTKELCQQVKQNLRELTTYCSREVTFVDVAGEGKSVEMQRHELLSLPDIVIGTPSRVVAHIDAGHLTLKETLEMIVVDEADLVFSFGYEDDMHALLRHLPRICQAFLMSATLSSDVESLKKLMLHSPVILKLQESQLPEPERLAQHVIRCVNEDDKYLLIYTFLKLKLIKGKSIIFVDNLDRCYKLKLFLEQFGIICCVLNSELPQNSRFHIVQQFNRGVYDYIIATDEQDEAEAEKQSKGKKEEGEIGDEKVADEMDNPDNEDGEKKSSKKPKGRNRNGNKDLEYGVVRGIDFRNVNNVINFDFPKSSRSYVHRVGRTARGNSKGQALSLVTAKDVPKMNAVEKALASEGSGYVLQPFTFAMGEIEGFRYRVEDVLKSVNKNAIRDARLKEIKAEILNSEKLKAHFEDNPEEINLLRHDKHSNVLRAQPHLKHIPSYMMPKSLLSTVSSSTKKVLAQPNRQRRKNHKSAPVSTEVSSDTPSTNQITKEASAIEQNDTNATSSRLVPSKVTGMSSQKRRAKEDPLKTFAFKSNKKVATSF